MAATGSEGRSGDDRALSAFLIGLSLYLFALAPFVPESTIGRGALDVVFVAVLFVAIFAVAPRRGHRIAAVAIFLASVAARAVHRAWPAAGLEAVTLLSALAFVALTTGLLFAQVMRRGAINAHRLRGAIAVYLLLGLAWGLGFAAVDGLVGGAFTGLADHGVGERRIGELTYFSFVCLTTVGFGDIVPVHPAARNLAVLEALTGQIYLAVVIARLVSLAIIGARRE